MLRKALGSQALIWITIQLLLGLSLFIVLLPGMGSERMQTRAFYLITTLIYFVSISAITQGAARLVMNRRQRMLVLIFVNGLLAALPLPLLYAGLQFAPGRNIAMELPLGGFLLRYIPVAVTVSALITITATRREKHSTQKRSEQTGDYLTVRTGGEYIPIEQRRIVYLSAHGNRVVVHTASREYEIRARLHEMESKLNPGSFHRIHKSFLLNIAYLGQLQYHAGGAYIARLKDEEETTLPVGRSFVSGLKERLQM